MGKFKETRDIKRWMDASVIMHAVKRHQEANNGKYAYGVTHNTSGAPIEIDRAYMITNASTTVGCNDPACGMVRKSRDCVNLSELIRDGYASYIPTSPSAINSWPQSLTGFYMKYNNDGSITVGACESERIDSITITK